MPATGQKIDGALHNGGNDSLCQTDFMPGYIPRIGAHRLKQW